MAVTGPPTVTLAAVPPLANRSPDGGAIDVHTHAMPLPLLQRLSDRGLADLSGVPDGTGRGFI